MCEMCAYQSHFAIGVLSSVEIRILKIMHGLAERNEMDVADDIFEAMETYSEYLRQNQEIAGKIGREMSQEQVAKVEQFFGPELMEDAIRATLAQLQLVAGVDLVNAARTEEVATAIANALAEAEEPDSPFDIPGLSEKEARDLFHDDEED